MTTTPAIALFDEVTAFDAPGPAAAPAGRAFDRHEPPEPGLMAVPVGVVAVHLPPRVSHPVAALNGWFR